MIKTIAIRNFKSIKELRLDCKKINILIGEPNSGKSNILESLGVFSYAAYSAYGDFRNFVRCEKINDLFCDGYLDEPVQIDIDGFSFSLQAKAGRFTGEVHGKKESLLARLEGGYEDLRFTGGLPEELRIFKSYKFAARSMFPHPETDFLLPPSGSNLLSLILARRELRSLANEIFAKYGLKLGLRPQENKIEVMRQSKDIVVSYPYALASDTLQRTIFYLAAVLSNRDSVLAFEEPESHAFPYYTKYFAETVALGKGHNQYFISTHNPYLLLPLLEKAPKDDVIILLTYLDDYQTKASPLSSEEMEEIMEIDVFSNLERFLERR
ncbi:MAG: AAA family ATPase [Chloroflexi bacterium]|nr:AAA family ATPase [Chloroflexota bacterium]